MKVSVGKHIERLQARVEHLHREVMRNGLTRLQRNHIETEIRVAALALEHFKAALGAEQELSRRAVG
jgi:hypothetical protein